ncbi:MAG: mechanosensitive ion channel family protein [Candidatus Geothermincolia bacterium]
MPGIAFAQAASVGQAFSDLWKDIVNIGPKWLVALAVLVLTWLIAKLVRIVVQKTVGKTSTQGHVDLLIARAASGLVFLAGFMVALSEIGMSFSAALATLGLASVGIGFALQGVLSNLFSGIILLIQHPFTIGDQIRVGDQEGVVENIRVRDTQILTYDGQRVFIPNKTVFDSSIINYSATATLRIDLKVQLEEGADLDKMRERALRALREGEGVLQQPEPIVLVEPDKENLVLVLRFWAESDRNREMKLKSAIMEKLHQ